jgi:hypothetical protein
VISAWAIAVREQRVVAEVVDGADGLAQRLAGDRGPVGAAAADVAVLLDDGDLLAVLGGAHGGTLAAGAGAEDDDVELLRGLCGHEDCLSGARAQRAVMRIRPGGP